MLLTDIIENAYAGARRIFLFLCRFDEQRLTLRIHRGRGSVHNGSNNGNSRSPDSSSRNSVKREKIKISVSYPSTETLNTKCNTLERTPSKCSQISVHYSNGQTQTQLCPASRNTHLKVNWILTSSIRASLSKGIINYLKCTNLLLILQSYFLLRTTMFFSVARWQFWRIVLSLLL